MTDFLEAFKCAGSNEKITTKWVRIGRSVFPFTSYEDVSEAYCVARDKTDATATGRTGLLAPKCEILEGDRVVAYVSYNGRVWECGEEPPFSQSDRRCLYDPAENQGPEKLCHKLCHKMQVKKH